MFYRSSSEARVYDLVESSIYQVMIVHDLSSDTFDTYFCDKRYGTFYFMFGVPDDHLDYDNVLELVENNIDDYIDYYEEYGYEIYDQFV